MRIPLRALVIVLLLCSVLSASESAKSLHNKGVKAEARQDYEAAFDYYKAAYDQKPEEMKYRVSYERVRFLAAASKIKRAQKLRDEGKLQEALALFEKAAEVDPSNDLAFQEIHRTQDLIRKQQGQPEAAPKKPEEDPLKKMVEEAAPPAQLGPLSSTPLTGLKMMESAKNVYETLGNLAGINVLFDPDYHPGTIAVDLQQVTLQEALDIVALESRTFWRPVTPNTIFVAQDNATKRRELEQQVVKTFYLGNVDSLAGGSELQDVQTALRTILEAPKLVQIPSQNALIMKGTPDQLALAQKVIDDIDRAKPEVIVDVVVAQVLHDRIRNLGILPPQNATIQLQGSTSTGTTTTNGTTTTGTNGLGLPNFNDLQHLNSTNYVLTNLDPLKVQLLLSDSNTQVMQSPRIRASDGEKAQLKIVDKIPIVVGSFGSPLGITGAVGALGVNTQFNYVDVGVTLEITPRVHEDGEITLKTVLEISSQSGTSPPIGGISQPIISTRHDEGTIRLKDGEMNMLGGIYENSDVHTNSGTPFLGQIPLIKYLFTQDNREKRVNELIFLLVPHIIRSTELSDLNRRAIDVGTGNGIDLRKIVKPGAAQPQSAPVNPAGRGVVPPASQPAPTGVPQTQPGPPQNPLTQQPPPAQDSSRSSAANSAAPASAGGFSLRFDPPQITPAQGSTFAVNVIASNAQDIYSVPLQVNYDPRVLQFVNVSNGGFLSKDGQTVALVHRDDSAAGILKISAERPPGAPGVSGSGTVFTLLFTAKDKGQGTLVLAAPTVRNSQNQQLQANAAQAAINVQ